MCGSSCDPAHQGTDGFRIETPAGEKSHLSRPLVGILWHDASVLLCPHQLASVEFSCLELAELAFSDFGAQTVLGKFGLKAPHPIFICSTMGQAFGETLIR
jgi:hypothetical protein